MKKLKERRAEQNFREKKYIRIVSRESRDGVQISIAVTSIAAALKIDLKLNDHLLLSLPVAVVIIVHLSTQQATTIQQWESTEYYKEYFHRQDVKITISVHSKTASLHSQPPPHQKKMSKIHNPRRNAVDEQMIMIPPLHAAVVVEKAGHDEKYA